MTMGTGGRHRDDHTLVDQAPSWPRALGAAAYHGIAGLFVRLVELETEADPVALLVQFLVAAGACIGAGPTFPVGGGTHVARFFAVLVGETAKGRKGTSWELVGYLFRAAAPSWMQDCTTSGLSTGEGLIHAVRDPRYEQPRGKKKSEKTEPELVDPGVEDKRLFVVEGEFARVLRVAERDGNTLSPVLRLAWDSGNLSVLTRNSPARATGAHISLVGHITVAELRRLLTTTEAANGMANRFLWCAVRRARLLPDGGNLPDLTSVVGELKRVLVAARRVGQMRRSAEARELWHAAYAELAADTASGLLGAIVARAEAQVLRLSIIYALLDGSGTVEVSHLEAALEVWRYCDESARYIFGDALGDVVADEILRALRDAPDGLTRTQIRDLFGRHQRSNRIDSALASLLKAKRARCETRATGGRPVELWRAESLRSHVSLRSREGKEEGEDGRQERGVATKEIEATKGIKADPASLSENTCAEQARGAVEPRSQVRR